MTQSEDPQEHLRRVAAMASEVVHRQREIAREMASVSGWTRAQQLNEEADRLIDEAEETYMLDVAYAYLELGLELPLTGRQEAVAARMHSAYALGLCTLEDALGEITSLADLDVEITHHQND